MTRINFRTLQEAFNNWTYEESNWRILRKNGTEFIESCKAADRNEAIINVICELSGTIKSWGGLALSTLTTLEQTTP